MSSGRAISRNCARCAVSSRAVWWIGLERRARQLELPARLERDRAAAGHVGEADDVRPVHDRLPAEQMLHAVQQRTDRAAALVGHRLVRIGGERELLVLGADAPLRLRLHPAANHATSSSRDSIGVRSTTSRAIRGFRQKGPRPYTRAPREGNRVLRHVFDCRCDTPLNTRVLAARKRPRVAAAALPVKGAERRETPGRARPRERLALPPGAPAIVRRISRAKRDARLPALHWRHFSAPGRAS